MLLENKGKLNWKMCLEKLLIDPPSTILFGKCTEPLHLEEFTGKHSLNSKLSINPNCFLFVIIGDHNVNHCRLALMLLYSLGNLCVFLFL